MRKDIALFGLTGLGAFGIWSATNSSGFTVEQFVKTSEDAKVARKAMTMGLAMCIVLGIVTYVIFKDLPSALGATVFGAILFAWYEWILRKKGL